MMPYERWRDLRARKFTPEEIAAVDADTARLLEAKMPKCDTVDMSCHERAVDYCAECGRDLCAAHMESPGCCAQQPAKSGREAETVEC